MTLDLSYASTRLVQMAQTFQPGAHAAPPSPAVDRGTVVGEWTSGGAEGVASPSAVRTIENVALVNGATVTLAVKGGRNTAGFERIDVVPTATPNAAPLSFRAEYLRLGGFRLANTGPGGLRVATARAEAAEASLPFPGADGTYTLKVFYTADATRPVSFAVRVKTPAAPEASPAR